MDSNIKSLNVSKARNFNLDVLRIILMFFIVLLHTLSNTTYVKSFSDHFSFNYFFINILFGIAYVAVNGYVLISGYFLVNSKGFKLKKLLFLFAEIWFYSVSIYLVLLITGNAAFGFKALINSVFPVLTRNYWFATVYVALYILHPFLNKFVFALNKQQHRAIIFVCIAFLCFWQNIPYFIDSLNIGGGMSLSWFITLYLTASYIRLYYTPDFKTTKHAANYLIAALCVPLSKFLLSLFKYTPLVNLAGETEIIVLSNFFFSYNSIFVYIASILLLIFFLNIKTSEKTSRFKSIVFKLAPLTFGVYLIHDNPFLKIWLWNMFAAQLESSSVLLPIYIFIIALLVFFTCLMIDYLRKLLSKPFVNCADKKLSKFNITQFSLFKKNKNNDI